MYVHALQCVGGVRVWMHWKFLIVINLMVVGGKVVSFCWDHGTVWIFVVPSMQPRLWFCQTSTDGSSYERKILNYTCICHKFKLDTR